MFIYGENGTNCQILYILSHQKQSILNTSEWCVNFFYFVFLKKFDLDPDPKMDPESDPDPDPELSKKSGPDPEIIFTASTHCF